MFQENKFKVEIISKLPESAIISLYRCAPPQHLFCIWLGGFRANRQNSLHASQSTEMKVHLPLQLFEVSSASNGWMVTMHVCSKDWDVQHSYMQQLQPSGQHFVLHTLQ